MEISCLLSFRYVIINLNSVLYFVGDIDSYNYTSGVDLPGRFDYWCTYTRNPHANSCVFSAASEDEAEYICSLDDNCRAFVITDEITWTGMMYQSVYSKFPH